MGFFRVILVPGTIGTGAYRVTPVCRVYGRPESPAAGAAAGAAAGVAVVAAVAAVAAVAGCTACL